MTQEALSSAAPPAISLDPATRATLFVVIAAYNEAGAIGRVVTELRQVYANVVVVDDGSSDDTWRNARDAGAIVLRHIINRGQGAALQTGIAYALGAGAQIVITFDADGQHRVEDIAALAAPISRGEVEISLGSRFLADRDAIPAGRRVVLLAAVVFMRMTSGVKLTDAHNGLRAFSRRAAEHLDIQLDRMAHASEVIDQIRNSGLSYREIPVRVRYTEYSLQKGQRSSAAFRVAWDYLVGRLLR
jgi:polyprenyl-phospho-N-acetylgalactosaminyl synthase